MGYRRNPIEFEEWYHCFNRGIDKRDVFQSEDDCRRFIQLLYLANDTASIKRDNFYHLSHADIIRRPRENQIVSIGAYCLMTNHFHLLLKEKTDGGISKFMHKVGTGYTMYFNERYARIGNLFLKPFRSKHVNTENYLRYVTQYIHLNVAERFEPGWKKGRVKNMRMLEVSLRAYPFSSLPDYLDTNRIERGILDTASIDAIGNRLPRLAGLLNEAQQYFKEVEHEF